MPVKKNVLVDVILLVGLILIGWAGYYWSPLLLPTADMAGTANPGCDLGKSACDAVIPTGGRIRLELAPRPLRVIEPMQVTVSLDGMAAERVTVDFAGVSMNMGLNRVALEMAGPGRFAGKATLPVCVTGSMAWEATVLVESGRRRVTVPFRFEVGH